MRACTVLLTAAFSVAILCPAQSATVRHTAPNHPAPRRVKPEGAAAVPEVILFNGVIYTGVGLAEGKPETVQAMAIGGGRVLALGTNDEITRLPDRIPSCMT